MEHTTANPFIPRASVIRYANSTFEARIHLPGAAAHVDVVPHENLILVTGSLSPRLQIDAEGKCTTVVYSDQPCGVFGRDIPVNLNPGTELVVLSAHQERDDYVVRYTVRNSISPRPNCADYANAAAGARPRSPSAQRGCGCANDASVGVNIVNDAAIGAGHGVNIPQAYVRPGANSLPPAILGRGPGGCGGYEYGNAAYNNLGYHNLYAVARGSVYNNNLGNVNRLAFHPNGGATF